MGRFGKAKRQALHMVLIQYTVIIGRGAEGWLKMAKNGEWYQPVICNESHIDWAIDYMTEKYWTYEGELER